MMQRLALCGVIVSALFAQCAWAKGDVREFNQNVEDKDRNFQEQSVSIPEYPSANGQWLDIYITPTFKGKPKLLVDSIQVLDNKSVIYVLNNQSPSGNDNVSFENLRCAEQSFFAEYNNGFRQLAFADTHNKRWLESKNAPWRDVGSNLSTSTPVQERLSHVFCEDGVPKNDQALQQRLQERAVFNPSRTLKIER